MAESTEELAQHHEVREALDQTTGRKTRAPEKSDQFFAHPGG